MAACSVTLSGKYDHIQPVLYSLCLLSITFWIKYMVVFITFKYIQATAAQYQCDLLKPYQPSQFLRSADSQKESQGKNVW